MPQFVLFFAFLFSFYMAQCQVRELGTQTKVVIPAKVHKISNHQAESKCSKPYFFENKPLLFLKNSTPYLSSLFIEANEYYYCSILHDRTIYLNKEHNK